MAKSKDAPSQLTVFVDKIGQLSRPQRILIFVAAFLAIGALFTFLLFKPYWTQKSELTTKLENKLNEVRVSQAKAAKLPKVREQRKKAEERLAKSAESLPKKKEVPELLDRMSLSGKEAGLEWTLFQPRSEVEYPEDSYVEMPVEMIVEGDYHGIASFFDKVAHLPRIVNINKYDIVPNNEQNGGWRRLVCTCQAVTYRFLEPEATDANKKKTNKK
ncbi:type 4a pilus biogenesis protein PilO [Desulfatibacillum aliphaticivorans]|uniref:type 4a pilus biogenesis protein PilO n=1 Tax=Desulfatibacillum aliphaticivorans TaxID=218208 RepID=UPI0004135687|nr:type 4a pilus biogenesis protein PilO [Desulfatibacillum aliphaticivorans]